jgi:hypothetical protein
MARNKLVNFAARFEYLGAIEAHWPDVLESLHNQTFPVYQTCWERNPNNTALQTLSGLSKASKQAGAKEFRKVEWAVQKWAKAYDFRDEWMWDASVQTMYRWVHQERIAKWTYLPAELDNPRFEAQFGYWIPFYSTWPEFKRMEDEIYRRELAKYRAAVRKRWGEGQPQLGQHALWTVLWQRGKSPEAIRLQHFRTTGKRVSLANIQLRVHAFATSAGLSLRAAKAGRGAK